MRRYRRNITDLSKFFCCAFRESIKFKIWSMVVSTPFEYAIMVLIVLNTILLMMKVRKLKKSG